MKKWLKIICSVFGLLLVYIQMGGITEIMAGDSEVLSEVTLAGARDDLELWRIAGNTTNSKIHAKIAQSLVNKIMIIRSVAPDVRKIKGEALETLCLLNENIDIVKSDKDKELADIAERYLSSIQIEVKNQISKRQKTMRGKGCFLSPNP